MTGHTLDGALAAAPYTIYQASFLAALITWDVRVFVFGMLTWLCGISNSYIKRFTRAAAGGAGESSTLFGASVGRPNAATGHNGRCCSYPPPAFTSHADAYKHHIAAGHSSESIGMPSGHSQLVWFAAAFWAVLLALAYDRDRKQGLDTEVALPLDRALTTGCLLALAAALVSYSRIPFGCHTAAQVIVGGAIGVGMGVGVAYALEDWFIGGDDAMF